MARFSPGTWVLATENLRQAHNMLAEGPDYLDVTAVTAPGLGELLELSVTLTHARTTMMMSHREAGRALTGLTGSLTEQGRGTGTGIAAILVGGFRATVWLERLGVVDRASVGVLCGLGAWMLGCRVRVASGIGTYADGYRLSGLTAKADVIVTGTDVLGLHHRDEDMVAELARLGVEALRPVIVVAGRNFVSSRELRLAGIEEARTVAPPGMGETDITAEQSEVLTQRVAGTWT